MRTPYTFVTILVLTSLALAGCGKSASDTKILGLNGDGDTIFVNPQSIRQMGNKTIIHQGMHFSKESIAEEERILSGVPPVIGTDTIIAYDCSQRTYEFLNRNLHYRGGDTSYLGNMGSGVVFPNSPNEMTMDYACMSGWRRWLSEKL